MQETGLLAEVGSGVLLFLCGLVRMVRRLLLWTPLTNWKSFLVLRFCLHYRHFVILVLVSAFYVYDRLIIHYIFLWSRLLTSTAFLFLNLQVTDLHRHNIDHITIPSSRGPDFGVLRRVEDVRPVNLLFSSRLPQHSYHIWCIYET